MMKKTMIWALMALTTVCNAQSDFKETFKCEVSYEVQGKIPDGIDFKPEIMNVEVVHKGDSLFFSDCKCKMINSFSFKCDSTNRETLDGYGEITKESFFAFTSDKRRHQYSINMKYRSLPKKVELKINNQIVPRNEMSSRDSINIALRRLESSVRNIENSFHLFDEAGYHLQKHTENFYIGTVLTVLGSIVAGAGAYNRIDDVVIIGGVCSLSGIVFILQSHNHIKKAGAKLQETMLKY